MAYPATALSFIAFAILWLHLSHFSWRDQAAFWPPFFSFALLVFGLWVGRALLIVALILTTLTLMGYWWSGNCFDLWMAAVGGGAVVGIGVWLRN